jgi:hypothetical protein
MTPMPLRGTAECVRLFVHKKTGVEGLGFRGRVGKSASLVTYVASLATSLRGTVECVRLFVHTQM